MSYIRLLTVSTAILLCAVIPFSDGRAQSIKVAALFNLTGNMSSIDGPAHKGVRLAVKQINDKGGVIDGRKIELVAVDTQSNLQKTVTAARDMVRSKDIVGGIGYSDTSYVLKGAPFFQDQGIPFVTTGATLPELPRLIGDYLFMTAFGDDAQAYALADYASRQLKVKTCIVWTDKTTDFTRALSGHFKRRLVQNSGRIVYEDFFRSGEKGFAPLVSRLRKVSPQPEALFIAAVPGDAGRIVKEVRQAGITLPILSGDGFDTPLIVSVPGKDLADNLHFSTHLFRGEKRPEVGDFMNAYKTEYGSEPENAFAALGFDAMHMLADALRRSGKLDGDSVRKALGATQMFRGVTGDISYIQPFAPPVKPVAIIQVTKGNLRLADTWKP